MEIAKTVFGGRSTEGYSDKAHKGLFIAFHYVTRLSTR